MHSVNLSCTQDRDDAHISSPFSSAHQCASSCSSRFIKSSWSAAEPQNCFSLTIFSHIGFEKALCPFLSSTTKLTHPDNCGRSNTTDAFSPVNVCSLMTPSLPINCTDLRPLTDNKSKLTDCGWFLASITVSPNITFCGYITGPNDA